MKTFYTERDIEDLHATGQTEIVVNDDVVLTDLAREKAADLGMSLVSAETGRSQARKMLRAFGAHLPAPSKDKAGTPSPPSSDAAPPPEASPIDPELVQHVKARVIARLGTTDYNGLLDRVIPQVIARLANNPTPSTHQQTANKSSDY